MTQQKERIIRIYKAEALYLRSSDVPEPIKETLYNRYTVRFYAEKVCAKCEHGPYRHTEEFCQPCGAFTGEVRLSGEYKVGKEKYVKVPLGDRLQVTSYLNSKGFNLKLFDKTPQARKYPMRFIGTLKDYQKDVPAKLKRAKRGVLKAPPRTGKTVMACATICHIGGKALILAAQREWLDGFYDTFMGSATTQKMSNLPKHMIGYCKKPSDFEKYAVCLATYQTFISENGHKVLEKVRNLFSTVIVDEAHGLAAQHFLRTISRFNAEYVFGLTATPGRKDGMYKLVDMVLGRVVHEIKREMLRPKWIPVRTQFRDNRSSGLWANLVKRLEKDPKRLKLIAEYAVKDIRAGHVVLIPFSQVAPVRALVQAINKIAGEKVAYEFSGSLRKDVRKKLIADAQQGLIPCLVGTIKLLSVGTNIPPASALYEVALSANVYSAEQRIARILTPHDGKPDPIVRFFMDEYKVRKSCARVEWFGVIRKKFNPLISPKDEEIFVGWMSGKNDAMDYGSRKRPLLGW